MNELLQTPAPGERLVRFVGDTVRFTLRRANGRSWPASWRAFLRTDLGHAVAARAEIIASVETRRPPTLASWRDLPLERDGDEWLCQIPLAEVGYFRAKAYVLDERGWQHWPDGPDTGLNVQPDFCRTRNIIYCAFPRMFGPTKAALTTADPRRDASLKALDAQGYTVIPPSGRLRDLIGELPHIFDTLGCHILHLLPVNPTPTTYARFGRFGSPYACGDLLAIDPALVEFDRRTTGIDQFRELSYAVHERGGRLFLDMVINHTGWGSTLQENHPDWFLRDAAGRFASPGAWGTTWEDLVELEPHHAALRRHFGDAFLEWCRRGVDGFRCDAGYKVPLPVWQYVTARVRQEFPDTVFLLEGLGGAWAATASLLTEGGLQWAYSELFQNYDGLQVAGYLDHALHQSERVGLLVHYSETHDNERLAARGRAWSLLRNRLCALTSRSGGFGFTCGVEWLAPERINVHSSRGLAWAQPDHIVDELARLNRLLADHPCFFDGAQLTRLSEVASPVYALRRVSAAGDDVVLVLVNTDLEADQSLRLPGDALASVAPAGEALVDLLGQPAPELAREAEAGVFTLPPASAYCLATQAEPRGLGGQDYRQRKACEALALAALSHYVPVERLGLAVRTTDRGLHAEVGRARRAGRTPPLDVSDPRGSLNEAGPAGGFLPSLGEWLASDPATFLSATTYLSATVRSDEVAAALRAAASEYPRVVVWRLPDRHRVVLLPPQHWLMVLDDVPFRASWTVEGGAASYPRHAVSVLTELGQIVCFPPQPEATAAVLELERYTATDRRVTAGVRFTTEPDGRAEPPAPPLSGTVLLTNGRGGMARLGVDFGAIQSKYDCLLGANLHPHLPVDRHIFAKRARLWVNADGFNSPLDGANLVAFSPGPPAQWQFLAHAGDGRTVEIQLRVGMIEGRNTTVLRLDRVARSSAGRKALPPEADVRLTLRVDLEDRNFHWETKRNPAAEHHFQVHCRPLSAASSRVGFAFTPAADRELRVWASAGQYHSQPEWCENIPHPLEQSRGQVGSGDAFSPGWFEVPLAAGAGITFVVSAEADEPSAAERVAGAGFDPERSTLDPGPSRPAPASTSAFGDRLAAAARAFVVRRDEARTVIAGYPWFLDWGRDTLICARGLLAAGMRDEVVQLLQVFGRFEQHGTLPNTIHGPDASNRDTSDAPLWYGVVCEELAAGQPDLLRETRVAQGERSLVDVLRAIASGYVQGTPNGIRMDPGSALVWSPSHFTWMDTNHPAGTPRAGYPVEIQALWIRLLRQLDRLGVPPIEEPWGTLAERARASLEAGFWLEEDGYYADVLVAPSGQPAPAAIAQRALRSNGLFPVALGLVAGERARRAVEAARRHLVVPGALRSLAPLEVVPPLPIHAADGRLLNNPHYPYCGRYEGDEDTRRKPAYHNGTAWVWTFPTYCEALVRAWDFAPGAIATAKAYLGSVQPVLAAGCLGHLPEILDGDAPHAQRGCDAQAWSATEFLRVWAWLGGLGTEG